MFNVGNKLAHLHPSTERLGYNVLSKVTEFVYCSRNSVDTVCLVTDDLDVFISLVENVPTQITEAKTNRYAVDLGSIGTDNVKMYIDSPNDGEVLLGFQCKNNGEILQNKTYKRKEKGILLDKFNAAEIPVKPAPIMHTSVEILSFNLLWIGKTGAENL